MTISSVLQEHVLVIAHSGRMLAQAVWKAGHRPLVLDLFADQDTEKVAEVLWQVEDLTLTIIRERVEQLRLMYKIDRVIYGSGMENQPETLAYLEKLFTIAGNTASVCAQLKNKKNFFKQLSDLGICFPEVAFNLPENSIDWLIKPINHIGGQGIRYCEKIAERNEYYQKYCTGESGSVLFCADGTQVDLIGFHRQWSLDNSFIFSGMVQECILPAIEQKRIQCWLEKLVNCYHFKGLGSLDFIWDGETCFFLEINPRPPVSVQLYPELDLLTAHISECLTVIAKEESVRAIQIMYAKQTCEIKRDVKWPEWSFDKPRITTRIKKGEPVCTILAQEKTAKLALESLLDKQKIIENIFY